MNKASASLAAASLVALSLFLSACGKSDSSADNEPGVLVGAKIGGPFTLTDQDSKRVSWSDFEGKYRLVYFGYSYCPDVCPLDLQKLMQGLKLFEVKYPARAAKVQPIFITVDPRRDTPSVLRAYISNFHPRLIGLTGTDAEIAAVAKEFAVVYNVEPGTTPDSYLVSHSRTPYLMGPDGKPIDLLPTDQLGTDEDEGSPQKVLALLEKRIK